MDARSQIRWEKSRRWVVFGGTLVGFLSVLVVAPILAAPGPSSVAAVVVQAQTTDAAIVGALQGLLTDSVAAVRLAAADALGDRAATAAVPALVAAMADTRSQVREEVAESLGQIADPAAIPILAQALSDQSRSVAEAAARALGQIRTADSAARLEGALLLPRDERFRQTVIRALGTTGQASAVEVLEGFLPLADRRLQESILESFAAAGTGPALAALLRAAASPDANLRLRAAQALAGN
jgi:HEAT repeat protein